MANRLRDQLLASPGASRALTAEEMLAFGRSVDPAQVDLSEYRQFCNERYARNTVFRNDHFELVVICWLPNQASSIHDHGRSYCLYVVVEGEMQEEMFVVNSAGRPRRQAARCYRRGEITIAGPADIHRIANTGGSDLVTVHLYSPPLDAAVTHFTPIPQYKTAGS